MKVCNVNRNAFYMVLGAVFKAFETKPLIAELGVLRGENAAAMYAAMDPKAMVLIDSWSTSANDAYSPFESLPPWVDPVETYDFYYGGPMRDQRTFDALYEQCVSRFEAYPNVSIIRAGTIEAIEKIKPATGIEKFDLVYIDANHQYEYILRDLMYYQDLVAPDGFIMLNDCCYSPAGVRQNLGVLEALGSFMKRSDFIPLAMTNTDFADVILARKGSAMEQAIDYVITNSDIVFVDIPYQLAPSARIVHGGLRTNISFC